METEAKQTEQNTQQEKAPLKEGTEVVLVEGQLTKIIHEQGQGELPQKGQQIFALYRGTLQDGQQFDSNQDRDSPFNFVLGEGRVIKGWEEGFASMKKGQKATLICGPEYAYGKRGSPPRIPANATLRFEVELLDFKDKKKQKWQLSDQEKVNEATNSKNQGNESFKQGNYKEAIAHYTEGIEYVESQQGQAAQNVLKILRLNAAQAQIKASQYNKAVQNCTKVLEKETSNLKALYRRGVAYSKNQQFQKAQADFEELLKNDPENTEAKKQLYNVKVAEKNLKLKQKKIFGGMFSKGGIYADEEKKSEEANQGNQQNQEDKVQQAAKQGENEAGSSQNSDKNKEQ